MKRLLSAEEVKYAVSLAPSRIVSPTRHGDWNHSVILTANVVGTDGFVRDERHSVEFCAIKVTKRKLGARWDTLSVSRPGERRLRDKEHDRWRMREVVIPKKATSAAARRHLLHIRDRLKLLLAPQHDLFGLGEAAAFCKALHDHIVVQDVMSG